MNNKNIKTLSFRDFDDLRKIWNEIFIADLWDTIDLNPKEYWMKLYSLSGKIIQYYESGLQWDISYTFLIQSYMSQAIILSAQWLCGLALKRLDKISSINFDQCKSLPTDQEHKNTSMLILDLKKAIEAIRDWSNVTWWIDFVWLINDISIILRG